MTVRRGPKRRDIHITLGFHPDEYAEIKELATASGLTFHEQVRKMTRLALDIEEAITNQVYRQQVKGGIK